MKVGIYAWAGMGNLGDDLLLETAAELVSGLSAEVLVIAEHSANNILNLPPANFLTWPKHTANQKSKEDFWNVVNSLDFVLFAGGGWLAGDRGIREPLNWALRAQKLKVPTASICLGIGPFNSFFSKTLGSYTLRKITTSGVRSVRASSDLYWAGKLGIPDFELMTDLAFASRRVIQTSVSGKRTETVIALPEISTSISGGKSPQELANEFVDLLDPELTKKAQFLSFQNGRHSDALFWKKYFPSVLTPTSTQEAFELLAKAKIVVSGRLHSSIFSVIAGVPKIWSIGYHHKFEVLEDLGLPVANWGNLELRYGSVDSNDLLALSKLMRAHISQSLRMVKVKNEQ